MNSYKVTFTCQNGHQQTITCSGVGREWADMWAERCDECGICGATITSEVEEIKEAE